MATATVTPSLIDWNTSRRHENRVVKLAISANPDVYVSGGLTVDLTTLTNPNNFPHAKFGRNPSSYLIANEPPGYVCVLTPGTNLTNWKLQFFIDSGANAAMAEFGNNTAIPAAISGFAELKIQFNSPKNL